MLYNIEKKDIQTLLDCFTCPHWDRDTKKCEGLNLCCFEYDAKTKTIIDGKTKLPLKVED